MGRPAGASTAQARAHLLLRQANGRSEVTVQIIHPYFAHLAAQISDRGCLPKVSIGAALQGAFCTGLTVAVSCQRRTERMCCVDAPAVDCSLLRCSPSVRRSRP